MPRACAHTRLEVRTESDRCKWVKCQDCKKRGPKKHSATLALIAFALAATSWNSRWG
jgi:hypothetical protein